MTGKPPDSADKNTRQVCDVLAERFAKTRRAKKTKLTATMKRRALKRKKPDNKPHPGPAAGS